MERTKLNNQSLHLQKLSEEEKTSRCILGRLYGQIATCNESTRNGRKYNRELWEKALSDELFKEKIENKSLFLELGHPTDREETDMSKVCACIPEVPKIVNGDLYAYVDILDTPNGRLLKTLCDYGFVPGISSRGSGDVMDNDEVDPDTFYLETWDIVQTPAVKSARLSISEGFDVSNVRLQKALCESIKSEKEENKKDMIESLKKLNINLTEEEDKSPENTEKEEPDDATTVSCEKSSDCINTESKQEADKDEEAKDVGSESLINSLKEAIKEKSDLERAVQLLQKQVAVANGKVIKTNEELAKYKSTVDSLNVKLKKLDTLNSQVRCLEEKVNAQNTLIENQKARLLKLVGARKQDAITSEKLTESISLKDTELSKCKNEIVALKKELEALKSSSENQKSEYRRKLERESTLKENYKTVANKVIDKYIDSKATALGIKPVEIKNKLSESFTLEDVDEICDELQSYELNIGSLPFSVDRKVKVKVRESVDNSSIARAKKAIVDRNEEDDEIDDSLMRLIGQ